MRKKWVLAAIMLGVILCFVVSGVGYGEIDEWLLETERESQMFAFWMLKLGM